MHDAPRPLLSRASSRTAAGQQPDTIGTGKIIGRVVDAASSQPIAGVAVGVQEREGLTSITDGEGRFILSGLAQGVHALELRHLAYGTHEQLVNVPPGATVELVLRLSAKAIELDPLEVRVTGWDPYLENQGFYRRQLRGGGGHFFNHEQIQRFGLRIALYQVPRLRISPADRGAFRFVPYYRKGLRYCSPPIWIDGMMTRLRGEAINDLITDSNIGAMEVYAPGQTPVEFLDIDECGAIVVWSRHRFRF